MHLHIHIHIGLHWARPHPPQNHDSTPAVAWAKTAVVARMYTYIHSCILRPVAWPLQSKIIVVVAVVVVVAAVVVALVVVVVVVLVVVCVCICECVALPRPDQNCEADPAVTARGPRAGRSQSVGQENTYSQTLDKKTHISSQSLSTNLTSST